MHSAHEQNFQLTGNKNLK